MNKYGFIGNSIYNQSGSRTLETTVFYYATVVSNTDELGANRIKAKIIGIDLGNDVPYAFPMVQKYVHIVPQVGETVLIFLPDVKNPHIDRMYVGPIIAQPQNLPKDTELYNAKSALDSSIKEPKPSPDTIPESKGVYPRTEDIAFQGRKNSDLIFRDNEVIMRAGQYDNNFRLGDIPKFNKVNPSYIQIKNDVVLRKGTEKVQEERGAAINIVSNKINLLTHKDGSPKFNLNDQQKNITDEELQKIVEKAHQLVFGDKLIEFLKLQQDAFKNHVHAYPGMPPEDVSGLQDIDKYMNFNLDSMLSKNIRIN